MVCRRDRTKKQRECTKGKFSSILILKAFPASCMVRIVYTELASSQCAAAIASKSWKRRCLCFTAGQGTQSCCAFFSPLHIFVHCTCIHRSPSGTLENTVPVSLWAGTVHILKPLRWIVEAAVCPHISEVRN